MSNIILFRSRNNQYYWKMVASNGQVVATGGEGYTTKWGAKRGIRRFQRLAADASIEVIE